MKLTIEQLTSKVGKILRQSFVNDNAGNKFEIATIEAGTRKSFGSYYFTFKSDVWGADCDMTINVSKKTVEFSWPSTGRNVSMALTAINSYKKMLDVGAEIQALFDCTDVVEEVDDKD